MKAVLLGAAMSVAVIATVEVGFRMTGGTPSISLGKTPVEFQWRMQHVAGRRMIYVAGDSRVEWGFADKICNAALRRLGISDVETMNAGYPGGSVAEVVRFILAVHEGPPGILVINYSPCGFYRWGVTPGAKNSALKLQDVLDDRIRCWLKGVLYTYDRQRYVFREHVAACLNGGPPRDVVWYRRDVYPGGFMQLRGRWSDGSAFDPKAWSLGMYDEQLGFMRKEMPKCRRRRAELLDVVAGARRTGWQVLLVRLPVGASQYRKECDLPAFLRFEAMAAAMGVPAIDYQQDPRLQPVSTYDESHLAPRSVRQMAGVLADDLAAFLSRGDLPAPQGRPAGGDLAAGDG